MVWGCWLCKNNFEVKKYIKAQENLDVICVLDGTLGVLVLGSPLTKKQSRVECGSKYLEPRTEARG